MYRFALVPESISENKTATWPILRDPNSITIAFLWENLTGLRFPVQLISRSSELRFSSRPLQPHQSMSFQGRQLSFLFFFPTYLFLAVLGLHCCKWAFSSCCEQGLLSSCGVQVSDWWLLLLQSMGSRACGLPQLQLLGSRAQAQQLKLRCRGLVALWYGGSSWTRDQTYDPYTGRWILNHWSTGKSSSFLLQLDGLVTLYYM